MKPQEQVAAGYDHVKGYRQWADAVVPPLRERYADKLVATLPRDSRVLELGCGPGVPVAALLAERFEVVGVDISGRMIQQATAAVPAAHFVQADIAVIDFDEGSFGGVVAFYSLIHVPREAHRAIFGRVFEWLAPGGVFVASLGATDQPEGWEQDWLGGGPMYWSFYDADTNCALLRQAGFEIDEASVLGQTEPPGDDVAFLWTVARKPH